VDEKQEVGALCPLTEGPIEQRPIDKSVSCPLRTKVRIAVRWIIVKYEADGTFFLFGEKYFREIEKGRRSARCFVNGELIPDRGWPDVLMQNGCRDESGGWLYTSDSWHGKVPSEQWPPDFRSVDRSVIPTFPQKFERDVDARDLLESGGSTYQNRNQESATIADEYAQRRYDNQPQSDDTRPKHPPETGVIYRSALETSTDIEHIHDFHTIHLFLPILGWPFPSAGCWLSTQALAFGVVVPAQTDPVFLLIAAYRICIGP
jgi:hypothetical protein